ncbi:hypothetical protein GOP47_0008571 [Adiantum capillus-veneris]|uniref:WRKY domain-containing protein n=1 Tax=Adiantum capillus-veneris TaxID=13818 RepID=A0A9D4UZ40_ADICA|nr:hypothetical protein GOP47_0008571 [Adiantum capillus-veneris]
MQAWQELANVAPLPESFHDTPSPLAHIDDSYFTLSQISDPYFSADELLEESLEEMLSASIQVNMCTDDYWQGQCSDQCMRISNRDDVDANMDCQLHLIESIFQQNMESHTNATSSARGSNMQPSPLGDISANGLQAGGTTSFTHPSPVFSDASSLPPWMHNQSFEHPATDAYMEGESIPEMLKGLLSPIPTYVNEYTTISASDAEPFNELLSQIPVNWNDNRTSSSETEDTETSSDNFFRGDASSFAPMVPPPSYQLNVPAARGGGQSLLNMGQEASVLQQHLEALNHQQATQGVQGSEDYVSFLVENGTPTIDDGYVWRKYGQKNIKDKMYPRAYFRCAQPDCPIKKQIESSTDVQGSVLITYYGRHHHPR